MIEIAISVESIERWVHVLASLAVFVIAWAEVDSVYGITQLKKANRRWVRKQWRIWFKTSQRYVRSKKHGS